MELSTGIQIISIILEVLIAIIGLRIATAGNKGYGYLIALTFSLYVIFDLSRQGLIPVPEAAGAPLFLIATISALVAAWLILQDVRRTGKQTIAREWL